MKPKMFLLGAKNIFGKVVGIISTGGERYYMMVDKHGVVSFMPADTVEISDDNV